MYILRFCIIKKGFHHKDRGPLNTDEKVSLPDSGDTNMDAKIP